MRDRGLLQHLARGSSQIGFVDGSRNRCQVQEQTDQKGAVWRKEERLHVHVTWAETRPTDQEHCKNSIYLRSSIMLEECITSCVSYGHTEYVPKTPH